MQTKAFYLSRQGYNSVLMTMACVWSFPRINTNPSNHIEGDAIIQDKIDHLNWTRDIQNERTIAAMSQIQRTYGILKLPHENKLWDNVDERLLNDRS